MDLGGCVNPRAFNLPTSNSCIFMGGDKSGTKKTAAKAQKKAKAAEKIARKEKKNATKSQHDKDDQDDEDLEDILEKVCSDLGSSLPPSATVATDLHSPWSSSRYDKNGKQRIRSRKNLLKDLQVDVPMRP